MTKSTRNVVYAPRFPIFRFDDDRVTTALLSTAIMLFAFLIVFSPPYFMDDRMLEGANVWAKPMKFFVSMSMHFLTVAILAQLITRDKRTSWPMAAATFMAVLALVLEISWVIFQSARGRKSHFNTDTIFEKLMYLSMGVGILFIIFVAFLLGVYILRYSKAVRGLKYGAAFGLIASTVTTLIVAGYMSASETRWIGQPVTYAVVPIFGWSTEIGDLRPAHFVSTHMMQTVPIIGFFADRLKIAPLTVVSVATVLQIILCLGLFFQALAGYPIF